MDLHKTPMGRKLLEKDIPRIATALERLVNLLDPEITDSTVGIGFAHKDYKQRKDGDVINGIYTYKESKDEN
jgi:hypothetical protein